MQYRRCEHVHGYCRIINGDVGQTGISYALMAKTLEVAEISGDEFAKMMEAAATGVGQNIDVMA